MVPEIRELIQRIDVSISDVTQTPSFIWNMPTG